MSGGKIVRCVHCQKLNIQYQQCTCRTTTPPDDCDCITTGNKYVPGPNCRARERRRWEAAMAAVPSIVEKLRKDSDD